MTRTVCVCVPFHLVLVHPWLASSHAYGPPLHIWCMCVLVCSNCNFYLLCPEVHLTSLFLLSTVKPVLAELRQADLISSEECEEPQDISDVVDVQKSKSPEVMSKTAEVLRRHGFEKESRLLAGRQSRPSSICLCYVVQWSLLMTVSCDIHYCPLIGGVLS